MPPWASLSPDPRRVLPAGGGAFLGNLAGGFETGRQVFHDRQTADAVNAYLDGIGGEPPAGRTLGNLAAPATPAGMPMGGTAPVGGVTAAPLAPVGTQNMAGANAALGADANAAAPLAGPGSQWAGMFAAAEQANGLPAGLLTRVADRESDFNPNARGAAGEIGMLQFMPGTAADMGIDPTDPAASIDGAGRYIAQNAAMFGGNLGLGVAGYNWGPGNVQQWLANGADPNAVPAITRAYVEEVTGQPIEAWLGQSGGGQARPAAPTIGAGAAQGQQSPFSPRDIVLLRAMAANPATLGQALEMITGAMGGGEPVEYGFTNVDGVLVRTNNRAGTAEPVYGGQQGPAAPDFGDESSLRGAFDRLTTDYRTVEQAYERMRATADSATGPGDMATIFAFMKMLDPNSVVRETEYATAQNATGVPDIVRNLWNSVLDGVRLTPEQRVEFMNQAGAIFTAAQGSYNRTAEYYRGLAQQYGMDPSRIVMPAQPPAPQAPEIPVPGAPAAPGAAMPPPVPVQPPPAAPVPQAAPAEQPEIPIGATATNPATGERIRWNGTQWIPYTE